MRDLQGIAEINGPRRVELQAERAATIERAAVRALPRVRNRVNNAPAYHGEYRGADGVTWTKVLNNSQLPICYTTPEAAIAAALLYHGTAKR